MNKSEQLWNRPNSETMCLNEFNASGNSAKEMSNVVITNPWLDSNDFDDDFLIPPPPTPPILSDVQNATIETSQFNIQQSTGLISNPPQLNVDFSTDSFPENFPSLNFFERIPPPQIIESQAQQFGWFPCNQMPPNNNHNQQFRPQVTQFPCNLNFPNKQFTNYPQSNQPFLPLNNSQVLPCNQLPVQHFQNEVTDQLNTKQTFISYPIPHKYKVTSTSDEPTSKSKTNKLKKSVNNKNTNIYDKTKSTINREGSKDNKLNSQNNSKHSHKEVNNKYNNKSEFSRNRKVNLTRKHSLSNNLRYSANNVILSPAQHNRKIIHRHSPSIRLNNKTELNSATSKNRNNSKNSTIKPSIKTKKPEELPKKLDKNTILKLVNSTTKYEPTIQKLLREKRSQLTQNLRNIYNEKQGPVSEQENGTEVTDGIIPNFTVDINNTDLIKGLEFLTEEMVTKITEENSLDTNNVNDIVMDDHSLKDESTTASHNNYGLGDMELPSNIDDLQIPSDVSSLFNFTEIMKEPAVDAKEEIGFNTVHEPNIVLGNLSPIKKDPIDIDVLVENNNLNKPITASDEASDSVNNENKNKETEIIDLDEDNNDYNKSLTPRENDIEIHDFVEKLSASSNIQNNNEIIKNVDSVEFSNLNDATNNTISEVIQTYTEMDILSEDKVSDTLETNSNNSYIQEKQINQICPVLKLEKDDHESDINVESDNLEIITLDDIENKTESTQEELKNDGLRHGTDDITVEIDGRKLVEIEQNSQLAGKENYENIKKDEKKSDVNEDKIKSPSKRQPEINDLDKETNGTIGKKTKQMNDNSMEFTELQTVIEKSLDVVSKIQTNSNKSVDEENLISDDKLKADTVSSANHTLNNNSTVEMSSNFEEKNLGLKNKTLTTNCVNVSNIKKSQECMDDGLTRIVSEPTQNDLCSISSEENATHSLDPNNILLKLYEIDLSIQKLMSKKMELYNQLNLLELENKKNATLKKTHTDNSLIQQNHQLGNKSKQSTVSRNSDQVRNSFNNIKNKKKKSKQKEKNKKKNYSKNKDNTTESPTKISLSSTEKVSSTKSTIEEVEKSKINFSVKSFNKKSSNYLKNTLHEKPSTSNSTNEFVSDYSKRKRDNSVNSDTESNNLSVISSNNNENHTKSKKLKENNKDLDLSDIDDASSTISNKSKSKPSKHVDTPYEHTNYKKKKLKRKNRICSDDESVISNSSQNSQTLRHKEFVLDTENDDNRANAVRISIQSKVFEPINLDSIKLSDEKVKDCVKPCFVSLTPIKDSETYCNQMYSDKEKTRSSLSSTIIDCDETKEPNLKKIVVSDESGSRMDSVSDKDTEDKPRNEISLKGVHKNKRSEQPKKNSILCIKVFNAVLVGAGEDGNLYKYDLETGNILEVGRAHKAAITSFIIDQSKSNETFIYTGSLDSNFKCFKFENLEEVNSIKLDNSIQCMDSKWNYIFIGTTSGYLYHYLLEKNKLDEDAKHLGKQSILVLKATTEGSRRILIVAPRNELISIRDAMSGLLLRYISSSSSSFIIYSVLLVDSIIYCGTNKSIILGYDFTNGDEITNLSAGKGIVCLLEYKKLLFAGCYDGFLYVFDLKSKQIITKLPGSGSMVLSIDVTENKIIIGCKNSTLLIRTIPEIIRSYIT